MKPIEQDLIDQIKQRFGVAIGAVDVDSFDPSIEVVPEKLVEVCRYLKEAAELQFDMLNLISGVDYLEPDPKKAAKVDWEPHLLVVYHLTSTRKRHRLVLKLTLPRWQGDVEGQLPELPTVAGVWRTADWHEREVYDLIGVRFIDHPDLRRILCPEDWVGYPLRKDYQMPIEYHGIRSPQP